MEDELVFYDCIRVLYNYGLVEINAKNEYEVESKGYSIHPCVHTWICTVLNVRVDAELPEAALRCTASHIPNQDLPDWSLIQRRLLSHANRYTIYIAGAKDNTRLNWTFSKLGNLYRGQGKLEQAEAMYLRALVGKQKALGAEHTSTLDTVHKLGNLYGGQGKLEQAEAMYLRALSGYEKVRM